MPVRGAGAAGAAGSRSGGLAPVRLPGRQSQGQAGRCGLGRGARGVHRVDTGRQVRLRARFHTGRDDVRRGAEPGG